MSTDRWQRANELFHAAIERGVEERHAFLAEASGGDEVLLREIERLVAAHERADGFIAGSAFAHAARVLAGQEWPAAGQRFGAYRILREVGHGGMGAVFLAERADEQYERRVAIKVIKRGMDTDTLLRRFRHERQILASLDHPNIARLLDAGTTESGLPYFVMEYVAGRPIDEYCDAHRLSITARLELFRQVCSAVAYAHQHLVVHRDLKPTNILVTEPASMDAGGAPKLLDFGIARLLHAGEEVQTAVTATGLRLMTPEYASPEQAQGLPATTLSDVYSLGVVLYRLLCGHLPYSVRSRAPQEVLEAIRTIEPEKPSVMITRAGAQSGADASVTPERAGGTRESSVDRLRRRLRGDLDTIVLTAIRKEPDRRYASVDRFSQDIQRHLAGLPVLARRDSLSYRGTKFVRRHTVAVAAALLLLVSLMAGLTGTAWQARAAAREAAKSQEISAFLTSLFELSDPDVSNGERVTARELLDQGARRVDLELRDQPEVQAQLLALLGEIHRKLGLFERADSLLTRALALRRDRLGPAHPDVGAVLASIGALRSDQGRSAEAERLLRQALAVREARLGERHADGAHSLRELASVLQTTGDLGEAESLLRRGLAIDSQAYGPVHADVARDLEILSNVLYSRSDHDGAIDAARRTLEIRREVLGEKHLETATAKNNLALYISQAGELDEAEELYRDVLAFDIDRLGEEHPYTATVTNNLASVLQRKGDLDQAEALYRQVLALDIRLFGEVHPNVATVVNNLAVVQRERGALDEAETLFRNALAMFRRLFGEGHHSVGTAHAHLAETLRRRGEYGEADSLYVVALERLRASFPDGHVRTASALLGRGGLLTDTGRASDGEPLLREALAIREHVLGSDETMTVEARQALGDCLVAQDRLADAEPLLLQAWRALDGKRYVQRQRRELAASLIALYERRGRPADAESYRQVLAGNDSVR